MTPQQHGDIMDRISTAILEDSLGLKPGEMLLVVTDTVRAELARPVFDKALALGLKASYIEMSPGRVNGEEPPGTVANAMLGADAVVAITKASITHTSAKKSFVVQGGRIISMPLGVGSNRYIRDIFESGGMTVDVRRMSENIDLLEARIKGTRLARVLTGLGTDLTIDYAGREFLRENGIVREPGGFTNLPAGEMWVAPVSADGTAIIDASVSNIGRLTSPLELAFAGGRVTSISGDQAEELERLLAPAGGQARRIGELGIGMNPRARICGLMLEDEKVGGTVHIALGNNMDFGGDNDAQLHVDMVITGPELYIDGERVDLHGYL